MLLSRRRSISVKNYMYRMMCRVSCVLLCCPDSDSLCRPSFGIYVSSSLHVDIRLSKSICHVDLAAGSQSLRQPRPPSPPLPPSAIRSGAATVAQPSSCMKPINYDAINDATVAAGSINIVDPAPLQTIDSRRVTMSTSCSISSLQQYFIRH